MKLPLLATIALFSTALGCSTPVRRGPPIFIPAPPIPPRLQVLLTFAGERDLKPKGGFSAAVLGKKTKRGIFFSKPYAAVPWQGKLYVTDTGAHALWVVDLRRRRISRLPGDEGMGKLKVPVNLAFDEEGSLFVTDTARHQIVVYDAQGRFVRTLGDSKTLTPSGIAVRGDRLVVSDVKKHKILVLSKATGATISSFGGPGKEPGKTGFPVNLALDGAGNIYVSEPITGRVQKFSPSGELLATFGRLGKRMGELVRPKGVAVDHAGRVWVADAATQYAQIFDAKGRLVLFFGGGSGKPGGLYLPAGVSVSRDPETLAALQPLVDDSFAMEAVVVIVSQYGPHRITIYALGQKKK